MGKKQINTGNPNPGSMLNKKTFQDFNNKQPDVNDPNEIKSVPQTKRNTKPLVKKKVS
ncbi:MAG: hypothetical protein AB7G44_09760 [Bacteroidia bacterium]